MRVRAQSNIITMPATKEALGKMVELSNLLKLAGTSAMSCRYATTEPNLIRLP